MSEEQPFDIIQYPPVTVEFFDHIKQEMTTRVGFIEQSGRFCYLEEKLYENGGAGLEFDHISPDNYHNETPYSTSLLSQLREGVEGLRLERGQEIIEAEKHTAPEILWNEIMADDAEINAYNKVLALIEKAGGE